MISGGIKDDEDLIIINGVAVNGWGMDPWFAVYSVCPYVWVHIVAINLVYWLYARNLRMTEGSAFWWTWTSAYIAVMVAFTIPAIMWFFIFCKECDGAHWMLYIFSMGSIGGPMLLFFIPLILALSNYVVGWNSGYVVDWNHRWMFWVTYFAFVIWNVALIVYGLFMAPAIKIWYFTKDWDVEEYVAAHRKKIAREREEKDEA